MHECLNKRELVGNEETDEGERGDGLVSRLSDCPGLGYSNLVTRKCHCGPPFSSPSLIVTPTPIPL